MSAENSNMEETIHEITTEKGVYQLSDSCYNLFLTSVLSPRTVLSAFTFSLNNEIYHTFILPIRGATQVRRALSMPTMNPVDTDVVQTCSYNSQEVSEELIMLGQAQRSAEKVRAKAQKKATEDEEAGRVETTHTIEATRANDAPRMTVYTCLQAQPGMKYSFEKKPTARSIFTDPTETLTYYVTMLHGPIGEVPESALSQWKVEMETLDGYHTIITARPFTDNFGYSGYEYITPRGNGPLMILDRLARKFHKEMLRVSDGTLADWRREHDFESHYPQEGVVEYHVKPSCAAGVQKIVWSDNDLLGKEVNIEVGKDDDDEITSGGSS